MAGVSFTFELDGLEDAQSRFAELDRVLAGDLVFNIGALLESSAKRRMADEKASPDGVPWPAWSDGYAKTRASRHSLLIGEGDLLDSIQNYSTTNEAVVGTNLVYGAIQQFGGAEVGKDIPARPFLGVSDHDAQDIRDLVMDTAEGVFK